MSEVRFQGPVGRGCFRCGQVGHVARDCAVGGGVQGRGRQEVRDERSCYRCGGVGHVARRCVGDVKCYKCEWVSGRFLVLV